MAPSTISNPVIQEETGERCCLRACAGGMEEEQCRASPHMDGVEIGEGEGMEAEPSSGGGGERREGGRAGHTYKNRERGKKKTEMR